VIAASQSSIREGFTKRTAMENFRSVWTSCVIEPP